MDLFAGPTPAFSGAKLPLRRPPPARGPGSRPGTVRYCFGQQTPRLRRRGLAAGGHHGSKCDPQACNSFAAEDGPPCALRVDGPDAALRFSLAGAAAGRLWRMAFSKPIASRMPSLYPPIFPFTETVGGADWVAASRLWHPQHAAHKGLPALS